VRVEFIHCTPDAERLVVKMARVSNPSNEDNWETGAKLIRYLISHKHWSPLEMCSMCVRINTERDIATQILRHRSFSFQEFSTRYAETVIAAVPDFRRQDLKNRQSSHDDFPDQQKSDLQFAAAKVIGSAFDAYSEMLEQGVAKETARRILPLCTPTTLYMHGTLRSWVHYIQLRCENGTQLEHQKIAEECKKIFIEQFPLIGQAAFES
jgi:thymidylate synthase (FAD)